MTTNRVRKVERMRLLHLQKRIEEENCMKCPFYNKPSTSYCLRCHSFSELNNIGNWLLNDTAIRKGRMNIEIKAAEFGPMTANRLSVEDYHTLKKEGKSDKKIIELLNVTVSSFKKWKADIGLAITKALLPQSPDVALAENLMSKTSTSSLF